MCGWQVVGQVPRMVHTHGVCATTKSLHLRRTTARPICFTPVPQALVTMAEERSLYTGMCAVSFLYTACVDGTLITDNRQKLMSSNCSSLQCLTYEIQISLHQLCELVQSILE